MATYKSWIAGCSGHRLTADEKAFFADERPWGFILFGRNVAEASQLRDLVAELKDVGGRPSTPILVDQEGGRVQRLRPPLAPSYPPSSHLGDLYARSRDAGERAAWLTGRLFAFDLAAFGFNADCLPCLDVPIHGANSVIGDRAYSLSADAVGTLGKAAADGLSAGGLLPVMKHVPGHGRGDADSHHSLPTVDVAREELAASDFLPFRAMRHLPAAMTAHILFRAIDPERPATLSPTVISQIVRGEIGFDGLLMTDDMSMKALRGDLEDLTRGVIEAGCDIALHCNGDMAEMRKVAAGVPVLAGTALRRAADAEAYGERKAEVADEAALRAEYSELTARVA